jgi:hypothetical protein
MGGPCRWGGTGRSWGAPRPWVTSKCRSWRCVALLVVVKVVAGAAEADMGEALWYKREFIGENRVRDPVTLGVVDVDVRLQPAVQPAVQPLGKQQQQNPHPSTAIYRSPADSQHACADALIVRRSCGS